MVIESVDEELQLVVHCGLEWASKEGVVDRNKRKSKTRGFCFSTRLAAVSYPTRLEVVQVAIKSYPA